MRTGAVRYVLAAAAAPLIVAGAWWAQSGRAGSGAADCEVRCLRDPAAAAVDCDCEAIDAARRAAGGFAWSIADVDPAEWWAERRKAEAERVASVANYLIVETTNIAPMPVIAYYEKEPPVAGEPPSFLRIEMPELVQMEWKARAAQATAPDEKAGAELMANPGAFLGVLAAGLDELGNRPGTGIVPGAGSEGLGKLAEALRKVPADIKAQEAADAADAAHQQGRDAQIDQFIAASAEKVGVDRAHLEFGLYYPDREPAAARFERRPEKYAGKYGPGAGGGGAIELCAYSPVRNCTPIPFDAMLCLVLVMKGPIETDWNGTPFTITGVQEWEALDPYFNDGPSELVLQRFEGLESTNSGFRRFVLEREQDDFRPAGPMRVAHRRRERMEAGGQASREIVRTVKKVEVNEGPPTQADITAMLIETLGQFLPGGPGH